MFTGIISDVGTIRSVEDRGDRRFRIASGYPAESIDLGASIACDGVCLTVVDRGAEGAGSWFDVDVSAETMARTTAGTWAAGRRLNLERALRVGDEIGGHIVSGHVDGVAEVVSVTPEGDSLRVRFRAPTALARFIAPKGSVALNGTSLTVNEVEGEVFGVNLIPHTRTVTTWSEVAEGQKVNLEVDTLARYVARLAEYSGA
ncbi:MAG: riboflavin synthase [Alphaproteobacteria bacterium]|nr:MAG: riboflavin synthase [Alphaproteobacteria bacterium]